MSPHKLQSLPQRVKGLFSQLERKVVIFIKYDCRREEEHKIAERIHNAVILHLTESLPDPPYKSFDVKPEEYFLDPQASG